MGEVGLQLAVSLESRWPTKLDQKPFDVVANVTGERGNNPRSAHQRSNLGIAGGFAAVMQTSELFPKLLRQSRQDMLLKLKIQEEFKSLSLKLSKLRSKHVRLQHSELEIRVELRKRICSH